MINKPMKAPSEGVVPEVIQAMLYPIVCSPKLDGIRAMNMHSGMMSSSMKTLGNLYMQTCMNDPELRGLDGELIVGLPYIDPNVPDDDVFNRTSGAIRRSSGEPDFTFYVFDDFTHTTRSYKDRWILPIQEKMFLNPRVKILEQRICHSFEEALAFEEELVEQGYEGMMARTLDAPYKPGRVTVREGYVLKRKPLEQSEGIIVDWFEQLENQNVKFTDELGHGKRSQHQENKVGKGTLGGVILKDPRWPEPVRIGTIIGGTKEWRQEMFDNPERMLGQIMTYVYQGIGSISAPRQARGKAAFRSTDDMTDF